MKRLLASIIALVVMAPIFWTSVNAGPRTNPTKKATRGKPPKEQAAKPEVALCPAVFLVRDPFIQVELHLNAAQKIAAGELAAEFNEPVWKLRDASSESAGVSDEVRRINDAADAKLKGILSAAQRDRLEQIVVRVQGPPAMAQPRIAERLALTDPQREKIVKLLNGARVAIKELQREASSAKGVPDLNRRIDKLSNGVQRDILATLASEQRERWNALLGQPIDLSRLQPLTAQAPELRDVEAWINTEPLTLAGLRGKVVALHFWTFG